MKFRNVIVALAVSAAATFGPAYGQTTARTVRWSGDRTDRVGACRAHRLRGAGNRRRRGHLVQWR